MIERTYGTTVDGTPITDDLVNALADEAEHGYDPAQLRGRGRPRLGDGPSVYLSIRVPPAMKEALTAKAEAEDVDESETVRRALNRYLTPSRPLGGR